MRIEQFKKTIKEFKNQLSFESIKFFNLEKINKTNLDVIIIIGMGGSGQVGDIISNLKKELDIKIPILCWKNWNLPKNTFKNPLYIFISFSGNTEETISGIKIAKNKAIVTSGGEMLKIANKQRLPLAYFINSGIKPRQGNGIMFFAILGILKQCFSNLKINKISIKNYESASSSIAAKLKNKIILLYSSSQNYFLSYNWKTRLNETGKSLAFTSILPEACHNEIEIFENKKFRKNIKVVIFRDNNDGKEIKNRIEKVKKLLKLKNIEFLEIKIEGKNKLESTFNSMALADWISYHLAKITGVNPEENNLIDTLKSIR